MEHIYEGVYYGNLVKASQLFESFRRDMIQSPEPWFVFQLKRNLTVHTYKIETLEDVLSSFDHFSKELSIFIKTLESLS